MFKLNRRAKIEKKVKNEKKKRKKTVQVNKLKVENQNRGRLFKIKYQRYHARFTRRQSVGIFQQITIAQIGAVFVN
jgi:hypothetical protein